MVMGISMGQCLRCGRSCDDAAEFCDECRSQLRTAFRQGSAMRASGEDAAWIEQQKTITQSIVKAPDTPLPPVLEPPPDSALQAFSGLNEAARRLAHEDAAVPAGRRLPHASRLTPFRDISAEIKRESTPLPQFVRMPSSSNSQELPGKVEQRTSSMWDERDTQPANAEQRALAAQSEEDRQDGRDGAWPDFWPWFDNEVEEKEEEDIWANRTDPLMTRRRPNSREAALIEAQDIQRAWAEGISTEPMPVQPPASRVKSPLRNIFIALAVFAIVALALDGVLLGALSGRPHSPPVRQSGPLVPTLILETDFVHVTSQPVDIQVALSNFPGNDQILLTHDVGESVQTTTSSTGIVITNAQGLAKATMIVTPEWGSGSHYIYAEDMKMQPRETASAQLVVLGAVPSLPARLVIESPALKQGVLDLGSGIQGSDSIQSLVLKNSSASGQITWSASSDQPWLLVSPNAGMFNQSQRVDIAVQRSAQPGNYTGTLKFFSNGAPIPIKVTMSILPIPANTPVLELSPAALTFVTTDGSSQTLTQTLTISNPGSQTLKWSLTPVPSTSASAGQSGVSGNWLSASPTSGTLPAHVSEQIRIAVSSAELLPGAYLGSLIFTALGTDGQQVPDSPQTVGVSLTVQPHCGLVTTPGYLTFTVVQGGASPSAQALSLNSTASCNGATLSWAALVSTPGSPANWLSVSPASGRLAGTAGEALTVSVNAAGLKPQPYTGYLVFTTPPNSSQAVSTQTVLVQLTVQPQPQALAPVMSASPLNLNFSSTSGQPNPPPQVVTITNNGGGTLDWSVSAQEFGGNCWLCVSPSGGKIAPDQTGTVTVNIDTANLSPGPYSGQVTLNGTDSGGHPASGSPQTITVNLVVQPPCTLTQPALNALTFTGVQGGSAPAPQSVLITGSGNCAWPLQLSATISPAGANNWLQATFTNNSIKGNGQSSSLQIAPNPNVFNALRPGTRTAQVTITATDSTGIQAQGSGETIGVTLTVEPPCAFVPLSQQQSNLSFTALQGTAVGPIPSIPLSETATCAPPVTYTVSSSAAAWLSASQPAQDTGSGSSLTLSINSTSLPAGTYTGQITIKATDANGNVVNKALSINVSLTIYLSVSGTVYACTGAPPACLTPTPLAGATVTVQSGPTSPPPVTADQNGNYTLSGLAAGTYTIAVSGTVNNVPYSGTQTITVSGNATGVNLNAYPG
jgi:hypothetical protein